MTEQAKESSPAMVLPPGARFYGILDSGYVRPSAWMGKCQALLEGGADLIQLRAKKETARQREELLKTILPLFVQTGVPLIVNDDIELALKYPRLGLHVGQDDLPAEEARRQLGPGRILGLSTHSPEQARAALALPPDTLSYFAVGPVFATPTKPDYQPVGLELVRAVSGWKPDLPFFCIGGVNRRTLPDVIEAGGRRAVVVSDVLRADDTAGAVREMRQALADARSPDSP